MTEFRPILEDDPSLVEKQLLLSARLDAPPAGGKLRTLVAFGVAAGAVTTGASATAATSALGVATVSKWLAVGVASGVLATGTVELVTRAIDPRPAPAPTAQTTAATPAPPRADLSPGIASARESIGDPVQRKSAARERSRNDQPQPGAKANADAQTLTEEVLAVDKARAALFSGDATTALRLLDDHGRTFKAPNLSPEATVLRIEALLAVGRSSEAKRIGDSLLRSHPGTAHAQRVRSLLTPKQ